MTTSLLNRAAQAVASKIRGSKTKADHKSRERKLRRTLLVDQLEAREMMSVSQLWFSGNTLVVKTDNASTSVQVNQSGSTIRIDEIGTNRTWSYNSASVGTVEFQGGNGNDRFVNNVLQLARESFRRSW